MIQRYKYFLLPVASGVLLALSQPSFPAGQWGRFLIWFALVPLLFFVQREDLSKRRVFFGGFLAGLIFLGTSVGWFWGAYPLEWAGIENKFLGFPLTLFIWLLSASELALFVGLFALTLNYFVRKNSPPVAAFWFLLFAPSLWILFEYFRAWGFGVFWLGSESLLGPHWTFGNLAYSLAESAPFLQLASVGGIYGLSFLIVFVNAAIFRTVQTNGGSFQRLIRPGFWNRRALRNFSPLIAAALLIAVLYPAGWLILKNKNVSGKETKVAILQTKIPSTFQPTFQRQMEILTQQFELLAEVVKNGKDSDIIVFPEGANLIGVLGEERSKNFFNEIFEGKQKLIIDSGPMIDENDKLSIATFYFDPQKGVLAQDEKHFLIPLGEYLPYWFKAAAAIAGEGEWTRRFEERRGYKKGPENRVFVWQNGSQEKKFASLLCSGFLSPNMNRLLANKGAEVLVVSGSESIFRGPDSLVKQKIAMAKFRAVENNRFYLQATNYDRAFIVNSKGQIQKIAPDLEPTALVDNIVLISEKTWYNKLGDWILILALLIIIAANKHNVNLLAKK